MKKIVLILSILLLSQGLVFADEIIDSKGSISKCQIITIADGYIEFQQNGSLNSFSREKEQPIFNDYVDVRVKGVIHQEIVRYYGKIIFKDFGGVKIRTKNGDYMQIPWYRVILIGVYNPN